MIGFYEIVNKFNENLIFDNSFYYMLNLSDNAYKGIATDLTALCQYLIPQNSGVKASTAVCIEEIFK